MPHGWLAAVEDGTAPREAEREPGPERDQGDPHPSLQQQLWAAPDAAMAGVSDGRSIVVKAHRPLPRRTRRR